MTPTRRNIVIVVISRIAACLVLLAAGVGVYFALFATRTQPELGAGDTAAPRVMVVAARAVPVQREWSGFGTAEAMDSADVPARVSATVLEIPGDVLRGVEVGRGELLVRLDDSDFHRQVEISTRAIESLSAQLARLEIEAESWARRLELVAEEVALAQAEFDRVRRAFEREVARPRELDVARSALVRASASEVATREELDKIAPRRAQLEADVLGQQAALKLAELNLDRCTIESPLAGVIESVDVEVGESLMAGQRVARVVSLRRVEVPLQLPASARGAIAVGDAVRLRSAGAGGREWSARVKRIGPRDDARTRTVSVYVEHEQEPDDGSLLAPGLFLEGRVVSGRPAPRWIVPRRAVHGDRVTLVVDGVVESRPVTVGFHLDRTFDETGVPDREWIVLQDPLPEGALVVLNGAQAPADGAAAQAVLPAEAAVASSGAGAREAHDGASP